MALPNRLFEAVAAGLPILACDAPAMRDLIQEYEIGGTFTEHTPDALASAVETIDLGSIELADSLRKASDDLDWGNEAVGFVNLVSSLAVTDTVGIVANKSIATNDRIRRFASSLGEAGFEVRVFAADQPQPGVRALECKYLDVRDDTRRSAKPALATAKRELKRLVKR